MFKKMISCVVCVWMLTMMLAVGAVAAPSEPMVFTLSVTEGGVGDTVTVSVSISENSYFTNTTFYLHYDASKVAFVDESMDVGDAAPSGNTMFDARNYAEYNFVKGVFVTVSGITDGGELIKMDFEVLDASPAAFSLSFDECVGVDENDVEFDVNYLVTGCVLHNDGTVTVPTGEPVVAVSTTATAQTPATTLPTMIVTDEGNNEIAIPVVTTTDAQGNAATVPVAVVTDANGATVTVPVIIVTDAQGSVATIPVADGTDANGNDVTIPVAIVTDTEGNVQTVPVMTSVDQDGNIVTVPVSTSATAATDNGNATTLVILIAVCVVVAATLAIVAMKLRKKNNA